MPYQQQWVPAPKDENLEVHEELPEGFNEDDALSLFCGVKIALGATTELMYYCYHCKGWIMGTPNEYLEDSLNTATLSGRQGSAFYCRRCGQEIAFDGILS